MNYLRWLIRAAACCVSTIGSAYAVGASTANFPPTRGYCGCAGWVALLDGMSSTCGRLDEGLSQSLPKVTATWKDAHLSKHEQSLKDMKVELLEEAIQQRTNAKATPQAALNTALATFATNCKVRLCYDDVAVPLSPGERVAYDAMIEFASSLLSARLLQQLANSPPSSWQRRHLNPTG